jgi:hypothetical protein
MLFNSIPLKRVAPELYIPFFGAFFRNTSERFTSMAMVIVGNTISNPCTNDSQNFWPF